MDIREKIEVNEGLTLLSQAIHSKDSIGRVKYEEQDKKSKIDL